MHNYSMLNAVQTPKKFPLLARLTSAMQPELEGRQPSSRSFTLFSKATAPWLSTEPRNSAI